MSDPFLGEIRIVGFNFAPRDWVMCQGQTMSIQQNAALFSLLGTTFGGDGVSNFKLPDFQGRSPVGMGSGAGLSTIVQGEKSGTESVTLTSNQMPMHTHTAQATVGIPAVAASSNVAAVPSETTVLGPISAGGRPGNLYSSDAANTNLKPFSAPVTVGTAGASQPVGIRNPFLGTNFIISVSGIFPSRS